MAEYPFVPAPPPLVDWPSLVRRLTSVAVDVGVEQVKATFRRRGEPIREAAPAPPAVTVRVLEAATEADGRRTGCPSCDAHTAVIEAYGRVMSAVFAAEDAGGGKRVPPNVASSVRLANGDLESARVHLRTLRDRVPAMAAQIDECIAAVDEAQAEIPAPDDVTPDSCRASAVKLEVAVRRTTLVADRFEDRLKVAQGNIRLKRLYDQAAAENWPADRFYQEFREEMGRGH